MRRNVLIRKMVNTESFSDDDGRMENEIKTIGLMIDLYCRGHHGSKDHLCSQCLKLFDYVEKRLEKCPIKENKPRCSKCPVHCYKPYMRQKIKAVMRYSGPRMFYRHPILTARHYLIKK